MIIKVRRVIVFVLAVTYLLPNVVFPSDENDKRVSFSAKMTFAQKYIWRGIDFQDDDPAIQPEVVLDFGGSGAYLGLWGNYALDAAWHKWDEIDIFTGYYFSLWEGRLSELNVDLSYTYFYFPRQDSDENSHEVALALRLPSLFHATETICLVPYTTFYYGWSPKGFNTFWNKLGIDCTIPVYALLPSQKEQFLNVYLETFYNDGYKPFETKSGFGHIAVGLHTTFEWHGINMTPNINYQWTLEDTINREDEFWYTFTLSYNF
jgi:hypothetical protein